MFLKFGIIDAVDIVAVALLLYYAYRVMKASRSLYVFIGIVFFVLMWLVVSQMLEMRLLGSIMSQLINVGVIGLIVLFQEDIRRFLYSMGSQHRVRRILRLFGVERSSNNSLVKENVMPIVMACTNMARQKVGALIVIERKINLDDFVATGETINADISQRLIENIFFKNSPLHDGAMIISKSHIKAAGCILPVAHDMSIPKEFGLRHRAALGMSQQSDAIVIVTSEETGRITVATEGKFRIRVSAEELESIIS